MSPILVKADISTQILNFLRTNSREEISSSLLPVYTHAEIYSEVKLVKKSLSIKKRNPKNCSKDKKVALEFLIILLSTYKNEKVVFVTDKAISSTLEVSVLAKRVESLEREIGVKRKSTVSTIVPYKQRKKSEKILIGAFNIANFGEAKVNRPDVH